jgi:hypothetical protein
MNHVDNFVRDAILDVSNILRFGTHLSRLLVIMARDFLLPTCECDSWSLPHKTSNLAATNVVRTHVEESSFQSYREDSLFLRWREFLVVYKVGFLFVVMPVGVGE